MQVEFNLVQILLAGVASMVVGFLWYSPLLFAKPWMKEMGLSEKKLKDTQKQMGPMYALSFVAALVTAFVLSHVTAMSADFFEYPVMTAALSSAFWMWLGFVAPVQMTDVIFGSKSWQLFGINTGYQFASLMAMAVVIGMLA